MKTYQNHSTATVSGALETAKLTIEANGKAFKEFVSGIYSDKAYAICRELIANVVDSHVAAGKPDHSFDLHLPTVFDPTFSIRDYGTSMTHHTVMTLYRTLFRSSKDDPNSEDSNKYVGKFGLGSKSPWAYTDSFQLTAYLDGTIRVYDLYFNGGSPSCSLFLEGEMEEDDEGGIQPDGVLITFPVEAKDVDDFHRAAKRALEPLKTQPKMTGRACEPEARTVQYEGKGWQLLDSSASTGAEALQGTVLYPLRFESIPNCPPHLKALLSAPFRIVYEIGQLDVITSREALSYDDVTAANVIKRLEEVMVEVRGLLKDQLAGITNYHDFCAIYHKLQGSFPKKVWEVIEQSPPKFKNRYAPGKFVEVKMHDKVTETIVKDSAGAYIRTDKKIEKRFGGGLEMTVFASNQYSTFQTCCRGIHDNFMGWKGLDKKNLRMETGTHVVYLLQDMREGAPRINYAGERVKQFVGRLPVEVRRKVMILWVKIYSDEDIKALNRLHVYLARPQFTVAKMEDIVLPKTEKMSFTRDDFKLPHSDGEWGSPKHDIEEYLTKHTVYYVGLRRNALVAEDWSGFTSKRIISLFTDMKKMGVLPKDAILLGFPQTTIKKMKAAFDDNMIDLKPSIIEACAKLYNRNNAVYETLNLNASSNWRRTRKGERKTQPYIYEIMYKIEEAIGDHIRETGGNKKLSNKAHFEKAVAGTILEDIQLMKLLSTNVTADNDLYLRFAMNFDTDKIVAEKAEVKRLARILQHEANVLGGKAIRQFPMFGLYVNNSFSGHYISRLMYRHFMDNK